MSIVFFGTPEFAVSSLKALIRSREEISLVVTQTDKIKGRGHKLTPPPIKLAAVDAGLTVIQPATLMDSVVSGKIAALKPEFIIVVAYGKILPKSVLEIPRRGCINVHASLLPKYRGAAPIAWAIMNGEKKTGITTMLMDEGLDSGPILLREELEITPEDTAYSLSKTLSELGASLLEKTLEGLRNGSVKPFPQTGEVSFAPALRKENGLLDWSRSADDICNFIRGMQPWPGAYSYINGEAVKILKAKPTAGNGAPGVIEKITPHEVIIGAGNGLLSIIELQPPGKKPMPASAFLQGRKLKQGMTLK
ncbi:MAG TPA: methionyl-tRNA formyltransferase [Nitrospiraceae bacterium]|nr:methionyl-tRNA formyltransferase [Nitrospiraceae bacterium]